MPDAEPKKESTMQIAFQDDAEELEIDYENDPFNIDEEDVQNEMFAKKGSEGRRSPSKQDDYDKKRKVHEHEKSKSSKTPKLLKKKMRLNVPSHLEIACNGIEVMRLRHVLFETLVQRKTLTEVYEDQMKIMNKDSKTMFKEAFNFDSPYKSGPKWANYVDEGPGTT